MIPPHRPEGSRHGDFLRNVKLEQLNSARRSLIESFAGTALDYSAVMNFARGQFGDVNFPAILFADGSKPMEELAKVGWAVKAAGLTDHELVTSNAHFIYYPVLHTGMVMRQPNHNREVEIDESQRQALKILLYGATRSLLYPVRFPEEVEPGGLILAEGKDNSYFVRPPTRLTQSCHGNPNNVFNIGLTEWTAASWAVDKLPHVLSMIPGHIRSAAIIELFSRASREFISTLKAAHIGGYLEVFLLGKLVNELLADDEGLARVGSQNIYADNFPTIYDSIKSRLREVNKTSAV